MPFQVYTESGPRQATEQDLAALQAGTEPFWLDIFEPKPEELAALGRVFSFHEISLEDCATYSELPKVEEFNKYLFVVLHGHGFNRETQEFEHRELHIFLGRNYMVTVASVPHVSVDAIREHVLKDPSLIRVGADSLFYRLVDLLVDRYIPLLDEWEADVEELEDRVLAGEADRLVEDIIQFKRRIIGLRRSLNPQREIFRVLSNHENPYVSPQVRVYLRDTYDHTYRIYEELEGLRDLLTSLMDAYRSNISLKMNEIMQKLTIIATIFMPLTFVVGLYGMNVDIPEAKLSHSYHFILLGMAVTAFFMMWFFRKKKWL